MFNEKLTFQIQNREIKIPFFPQPQINPKNTNPKIVQTIQRTRFKSLK